MAAISIRSTGASSARSTLSNARDATSTVGTEHHLERSDTVGDTGGTGGTAGTGGAAAAARFDPNLATRFDRAHYYTHPEAYVPTFHKTIAPHISVLVTTMYTWTVRLWPCLACKCSPRRLNPHRYWDRRFPRMLSDDQVMASDCMLIAFLISSPMTR